MPGSAAPHFDGERLRRPRFHALVGEGRLRDGVGADDGTALHYVGTDLYQIVTSRPRAGAYRVAAAGGAVVETPLPVRYLGR